MFTFFFTVEVLVKILGLGAWHFFSENAFNRFDFLLVALALVELFTLVIYDAYDPRPSSEYGDGASEPFLYSSYSSYSNSSSAPTSDYDAYAESSDDASFANSPQSEVLAVLSYLKALRTFRVFKMFQYLSSLRVIGEGTSPYGFPKLGRRRVCFAECSPVRYSRDAVRNTNTFGKHFRETVLVSSLSSFVSIAALLFLFTIVFAIVGLHVFGGTALSRNFPGTFPPNTHRLRDCAYSSCVLEVLRPEGIIPVRTVTPSCLRNTMEYGISNPGYTMEYRAGPLSNPGYTHPGYTRGPRD